jgi:hypothetical protein
MNYEEHTFRCASCGRERPISKCAETDAMGYLYCEVCMDLDDEEDDG